VLDWAGTPVARVRLGSATTIEEIARLCELLEGRRASPTVVAWLDPDGRTSLEQLEADGLLARLAAANIEVETERPQRAAEPAGGISLATGIGPADGAGWRLASLETCALAIRDGRIADPREEREWAGRALIPATVPPDGRFHVAPRDPVVARSAAETASFPMGAPLDRPLRGPLLCRADSLPATAILPWGARLLPEEGDVASFSRHALEQEVPGFADFARAARASFVAARGELGRGGGEPERAALALAELGVRATFASDYDPSFRARLVRAGVLPLRYLRESDAAAFEAGDELEIPGVPDALAEEQPIPVRNLTRGLQCLVSHDLDAYALALVRDGGLLAHALVESREMSA
jgi:aconitate hydratase